MDIFEFENMINAYADEERQASEEYKNLADYANAIGLLHTVSGRINAIALDEANHHQFFRELYERLTSPTEHLQPGPTKLEHRPFPQTYGDWVNLAEDIKARLPETDWPIVNTDLNIIAGNYPGDVDDTKRRLVNKADELGIK